jgi:GT2 family glycosyltransferase
VNHNVGIVVPTMGTRLDLLRQCLESIREAGTCFVCIVVPNSISLEGELDARLWDQVIDDPGLGLAQAINRGIETLPKSVEFCNWLGDDDLLEPKSIENSKYELENSPSVVLVYGNCQYVDTNGIKIWKNSFGTIASLVLSFGPCLIPQPGSLFRRSTFNEIGGLNSEFGWAFDYDLFLRLSKKGKLKYLNRDTASFRWHPDSLTVGQREKSVNEASNVRVLNYSKSMKVLAPMWEPVVKFATLHAPKLFERK